MFQLDTVVVITPTGAPMGLTDQLALLGLIATTIGLAFAGWQLRRGRLTTRATFLLELYRSMNEHNEVHRKFRFGGWRNGTGPSTPEESMQVGRLLGLFEYIALLVKDGVLTLGHVDQLYAYRLVYPFTNAEVQARYFQPKGGWDNVVALEKKLQSKPLYSAMKALALQNANHRTEASMATAQPTAWSPDTTIFTVTDNGELHGIRRVRDALREAGVPESGITLSTDEAVRKAAQRLVSSHVPAGFSQHQIPAILAGSDTMHFLTRAEPHADFPEHVHQDDDGLRLVIAGSITFRGTVLGPGDWFHVPRGEAYAFTAGDEGCLLYHVYGPAS